MAIKIAIGGSRAAAGAVTALALVFIAAGEVHAGAGPDPLPHRAVYDLALKRADSDSGIAGVDGRMVLEWADACEGYTTTQQIRMRIQRAEGRLVDSDFSVASWESKDGNRFRFKIRNVIDGDLVEEFGGLAERNEARRQGVAKMTKPREFDLPLPIGTVFPSEHAAILAREAQNGATRIEVRVFDGTGEEGIFDAIAFVTGHVEAGDAQTGLPELDKQNAWRMHMAYFRVGDLTGLPEYEVGFRLFANGVADQLVLDYGDFVVGSKIAHFEALPVSGC